VWGLFGFPIVFVSDVYFLVAHPFSHPQSSDLMKYMRLPIGETPSQLLLQIQIGVFRPVVYHGLSSAFIILPYIILWVLATPLVTMREQLVDLFLVGLGRRAPLLHVLRSMPVVDYALEGDLQPGHVEEILTVAHSCNGLRQLTFGASNQVDLNHLPQLLHLCRNVDRLDVADWMVFTAPGSLKIRGRFPTPPLQKAEGMSLLQALAKTEFLTSMELTALGEEGASSFIEAAARQQNFESAKWRLTEPSLVLNLNEDRFGTPGARRLAQATATLQGLTRLSLFLAQNELEEEGGRAVAEAAAPLQELTYLWLDLNFNGIGEAGRRAVAEAVRSLPSLTKLTLYLRSSGITGAGCESIAAAIRTHPALRKLDLSLYDHSLTAECIKSVEKSICEALPPGQAWLWF